MRRVRTTGGVLMAVAGLVLAACGSSGSSAASTPSTARETTSAPTAASPTAPHSTTKPSDPAAADAIAQFALTASLNAAKQTYDDTYDFTAVTPESLAPTVPNVHYAPLAQAAAGVVGVLAQDKHDVLFVTKSTSGRWYCVTDNDEDGVSYGVGPSLDKLNSNGECQLDAWPPPA